MLLHDNRMEAELGITLALAPHRSGYTLETVQAVLEHLFGKGLYRVSAECDIRNAPSARLLKRAGFQLQGGRPEFTVDINTGEGTDTLLFGLLASRCREPRSPDGVTQPDRPAHGRRSSGGVRG